MSKSDSQNRYPSEWRVPYRAAIFAEVNDSEMVNRIADAEDAIVERMRALLRATGADADGRVAVIDADLKLSHDLLGHAHALAAAVEITDIDAIHRKPRGRGRAADNRYRVVGIPGGLAADAYARNQFGQLQCVNVTHGFLIDSDFEYGNS